MCKLNNDKIIIIDDYWIPVKPGGIDEKSRIRETVIAAEILGHNKDRYGFLIYRWGDFPEVKIVDEKTVQLIYHFRPDTSHLVF